MNRADRRKLKKNGCNERGEKIHKLTDKQLDDIVLKALAMKRQEITEQVTSTVTSTFLLFCLDVLHTKFGFGKMKLKRFKFFMDDLSDSVVEEYLTLAEVQDNLQDKIDLEFMYRSISEGEIWTKSHWGDYEQVAPYPVKTKE